MKNGTFSSFHHFIAIAELVLLLLLLASVHSGAATGQEVKGPPALPKDLLEKLIEESRELESAANSDALRMISQGAYDLTPVAEYVRRNPAPESYLALIVLLREAPELCRELNPKTKAAVLCPLVVCVGKLHYERPSSAFAVGKSHMEYGEAGVLLRELPAYASAPFLRDYLVHIDRVNTDITTLDVKTSMGNYAFWFLQVALGKRPSLGNLKQRRKLARYLERVSFSDCPKEVPLPSDVIEVLVEESSAGRSFADSTAVWRLYDKDFDLSGVAKLVRERPDVTSYHLLMALRYADLTLYNQLPDGVKAQVLTDALYNSDALLPDWGNSVWTRPLFNPEGIPRKDKESLRVLFRPGRATKALMETGEAAVELLEAVVEKSFVAQSDPDNDEPALQHWLEVEKLSRRLLDAVQSRNLVYTDSHS
jgi:hypothetical protein